MYGWDDATEFAFFDKYYKNILEECEMLPKANEIINQLKKEGNSIHFITARLTNIDNCDTEGITIKSLKSFNIPYDSLDISVKYKLTFCKENNIDLLIEDSYETCKELNDFGIKTLLMTT